jgi:hypothetical protein
MLDEIEEAGTGEAPTRGLGGHLRRHHGCELYRACVSAARPRMNDVGDLVRQQSLAFHRSRLIVDGGDVDVRPAGECPSAQPARGCIDPWTRVDTDGVERGVRRSRHVATFGP